MPTRFATLALVLLLAPLASSAQTSLDETAAPRQGTLQVSTAAPGVLDLQIAPEAPNPVTECPGFFTLGAPDVAVQWSGAGPLRIWVRSAVDAVLIVRTPTGETLCVDDAEGVQPAIEIDQAPAGRYAAWVGAFGSDLNESPAATLYAGPPLPPSSLREPDVSTPSTVVMGPLSEPSVEAVTPGGMYAASALGMPDVCTGFFDAAPTLRFSAEAPYFLTAESDVDLVLAVRSPDGSWMCDDDRGEGTNPAVEITNSMQQHVVWVGTFRGYARGDAPEATLIGTSEAPEDEGMGFPMTPPHDFEPNYFSEAEYVPLDLTSRGIEMTLGAQDAMQELQLDVFGETSNPVSGNACSGAISPMASATLSFQGAGPLALTASAQDDLIMVVRTASGEWFCSDDAAGRDPGIQIDDPAGEVTVWVGTFSQGERTRATLTAHRAELVDVLPEVEEIYDDYVDAPSISYSDGVYSGSGLTPEAQTLAVTLGLESMVGAGGMVSNPVNGDACVGFVSEAPSASVVAGDGTLAFRASGDADFTLTVRTPNGEWFCSDDHMGVNPGIEVSGGGDGVYAIWVGTFTMQNTPAEALLTVEDGPLSSSR